MGLTFGRITRSFFDNVPFERIFHLGGESLVAKTGVTSKGMKYTKLYNTDGELISWKNSLNGKIKKGRYEKVGMYDYNKGVETQLAGNKKLTTIRFDGTEKAPDKSRRLFDDDPFDPLNKRNPLSPNYNPLYNDDPYGILNNDPFSNPWDKNPWDL